ncbi:PAC2 family-domain-containing protein [Cantharellus anzutake]|uniref:PAC2 family-domain-containing protein n=1 Tax=Cantharellus anzutake TaxID=1750568 RepID=UPI0019075727|nr:PAC2 family-domain-containing protein [Cantharellus anzutake]KAF8332034.1 PAC2 family-domain-containing protein [Cantharellus anzutake]
MEFQATTTVPLPFQDTTLVIPIVSAANLGQLAVDLLVSSVGMQRVGIFDSEYLFPVIGGREDGLPGITTPLELFGKEGHPFYLLQQRSPVIKSCKSEFISALIDFAQKQKFSSVLILSGLDLSHRDDAHMITPVYHLLPSHNRSLAPSSGPISTLSALIPAYTGRTDLKDLHLPSSGITKQLLRSLPPTGFPATGVILQYVLEGDNREDAYLMANIVGRVLGLSEFGRHLQFSWKEPSSWKQGLFGTPHDQTLFG